MRSNLVVDGDVRPAEAIDRLLGVAHYGQPTLSWEQLLPASIGLLVARQKQRQLCLGWVGVLELVDQDCAKASAEVVARRRGVAEQIASPEQEVVEVGAP